jgi:hypothetical protein
MAVHVAREQGSGVLGGIGEAAADVGHQGVDRRAGDQIGHRRILERMDRRLHQTHGPSSVTHFGDSYAWRARADASVGRDDP